MPKIRFGTSGWRAIIAEDFTFENVKRVTQAIAEYLQETGQSERGVVVGHDERFLSREFAIAAACVLAKNRIQVYLTPRSCPTPAISYQTIRLRAAGAINITASHNPPQYNGLKYSPAWGGPAPTAITQAIADRANRLLEMSASIEAADFQDAQEEGGIQILDPMPDYLQQIRDLVDLEVIRRATPEVVVDVMYGAGRGYLETLLQEADCRLTVLHHESNPGFGTLHSSEPAGDNLQELKRAIQRQRAIVGLAVDGDADRFGIVDGNGEPINPNFILGLLLDYLVRTRGWTGFVVRTIPSSHFIDAVAAQHEVQVVRVPVGFKYIAEEILKAPEAFIIGGEESGGLTVRGHVPEKDGILACLLVLEMIVREGKSLPELLEEQFARVGRFYYERRGIPVAGERMERLKRLESLPTELAGYRLTRVLMPRQLGEWDGYKAFLESNDSRAPAWYAFRLSGTEPVVRCYAEADSPEAVKRLADAAEAFIRGE